MLFIVCSLVFIVFVKCGCSDDVFTNRFCDIRFTPTFIDKTFLIREVFQHDYLVINAPHNFGKSTNIGMLNMFLSNLRTKETIQEYFNGTEIWKDESFVTENMGEYPVILYNTSVCGVVLDEDHMLTTFKYILYTTFRDHEYLLKSTNISGDNMRLLEVFMNLKMVQCMKIEAVLKGLSFLAHVLYQHHGKPVILLVDGFGSGVMERMLVDNNDFKYLSLMMVKWYNAIINDTLSQKIISRALVSGETWLYGLRDPPRSLFQKVDFMENKRFSHFYGFTYDELEYLLCKFNIPMDQRSQVLKWYCGYSTADGEVKVCNPYSILRYLASPYKTIRVYWTGSPTGPELLQRMVESVGFQKHILDLVFNRPINISLATGKIADDVHSLRQKVEKLQPDTEGFICQVLMEVGYFTHSGKPPFGGASLRFANEEVRLTIDKFISLLSFI